MINLKSNYKDYLFLLTILTFGLLLFIYFGYDPSLQAWVAVGTGMSYVLWGVLHHLLQKDFHWRVLVEYLVVAFFGATLMLVLLGRV